MMELVTKNGLDLNDEAEIKNIFDLDKINFSSEKTMFDSLILKMDK